MTSVLQTFFKKSNFKYYTTWSNLLFYIVVLLYFISYASGYYIIPSWLLYAVIVNIIAVGIIGNILCSFNFDNVVNGVSNEYPDQNLVNLSRHISISNFITHTLPLVLTIVLLLFVKPGPFNLESSFIFLFVLSLVWLLIPTSNGSRFIEKIQEVYLNPPILSFLLLPIVWLIFLKLIDYSYKKCSTSS